MAGKTGMRAAQRGQALTETVIILPIVVVVILGALQIMMLQHGRVMTDYAAFAAARSGIVHNGDRRVMRNAALIATLPLYQRTDSASRAFEAWAKVTAAAEISGAVDTGVATLEKLGGDLLGVNLGGITQDVSLIRVEVRGPTDAHVQSAHQYYDQQEAQARQKDELGPLEFPRNEIDFDNRELLKTQPELGRLAVDVRVLYPLRVPVVNALIFNLWLAQELLGATRVTSDITEWAEGKARVYGGSTSGEELKEAVRQHSGEGPLDDFLTTPRRIREIRTLRWVAENTGVYLLPLHSNYAMQMQSNMFLDNTREPTFFGVGG